jgi:hypothetical protein
MMDINLEGLSPADLAKLAQEIQNKLSDSEVNKRLDYGAYAYNTIINQLYKRFSARRVDWVRTWSQMKIGKKKQFTKSWLAAVKKFHQLGFDNNMKLNDLVIELVVESHYFDELGCTYEALSTSLDQIMMLFDMNFPDYLNSGAITLLIRKLKDD